MTFREARRLNCGSSLYLTWSGVRGKRIKSPLKMLEWVSGCIAIGKFGVEGLAIRNIVLPP